VNDIRVPHRAGTSAAGSDSISQRFRVHGSNPELSRKWVRARSRRHHHFEDCAEASLTLRTAMLVSAKKFQGFLKETVNV
ncbi:MAG TPA: hypothetical protein VFE51_21860, partial [Verrucomicrobiae bacterium]|nr:hypothetical protein [Verrucomicrobiae bacterium]